MACLECGDTGVVEALGDCPECKGLQVCYVNGIGRECVDCEGTGYIGFVDCQECDVAAQARALQKRSA